MEKLTIKIIIFLVILFMFIYGNIWLFNHINGWLGILGIIITILIAIKIISKQLNKTK